MPIEKITIAGSDSGRIPPIEALLCQYVLNDKQQFVVLSIDFNQHPFDFDNVPGISYRKMGKLLAQSEIFKQQIINSLNIDCWDWVEHPNPEIILITKLN